MKSQKLDYINIALMFVALAFAYYLPFKFFILAYAILGPLHYLTEINWLEKKDFFILDRKKVYLLILCTFVMTIPYTIFNLMDFEYNQELKHGLEKFLYILSSHTNVFILVSLILAFALVIFKKYWKIIALIVAAFAIGLLAIENEMFIFFIGVLLPTIVHVYLFTLLFMLYGAIKSKSKVGFISVGVLILIPVIISNFEIDPMNFIPEVHIQEQYNGFNFHTINNVLANVLGFTDSNQAYSIISPIGIKVQIFITFAYIYHYLNWFSKTTVIGWHKNLTSKKIILILSIWLLSIGLYFYDFRIGFIVFLFLSFLHVVLEFPLNFVTISEIGKKLFSKKS